MLCVAAPAFAVGLVPAHADQNQTATEPLKNLSLEQLGKIRVTSVTKEPEEVWNTPAAIYVITQQAIKRSGATSIPEALRLAPGVEVARIDSNKWSIGIRGFGSRLSRDVLVMIDGRTVYSTLLAGTYWEVQDLPMEDVDRIEVIRGPGGALRGPNAVNGVINIITKSSKDTRGETVAMGGGNVDQGSFTAQFGAGNGRTFDYRVYGMGFDRGPEQHIDGDNYDSWRDIQGGFRTDFTRHNNDHFMVQGEMYKEGAGETVTAVTYAAPYSQVLRGTEHLSGGDIVASWHRTQGYGTDFQVEAYYDRTNRREPNFQDLRDTFDLDFLDRFRLPGRQQISWGLGVRASHGSNPTVVSGLYFVPESRTDRLYSGFVNDEIGIVEHRLSVAVGTKLLKTNYTGLEWEPSVRLLWTPGRTQSFWAAFTSALRTPSDAERAFYLSGFVGFSPTGTPIFARFNANPSFHSEQLDCYEPVYRQLFGRNLYVDIDGFYNRYHDLFSEDITAPAYFETSPPPPHDLIPAEFGNGIEGTTSGVEVAPEWKPKPFWRLRASYSYLEMKLKRGPNSMDVGTSPIVTGSSPRNQLTAESGFNITRAWDLDLRYRFVSALPALGIKSYSTADARLGWYVRPDLELSIAGQNLLQPYHFEYPSDPGPMVGIKRSIFVEITWQRSEGPSNGP